MFREAVSQDYNRIEEIWQRCFGDDVEEIRSFYHSLPFRRTFVWDEGGTVVSIVNLLPARLHKKSSTKPEKIWYLYAVATAPEYQGKGIGTKLLMKTVKQIHDWGAEGFLVPADEGLEVFYEKRGFQTIGRPEESDKKESRIEWPVTIQEYAIKTLTKEEKQGKTVMYTGLWMKEDGSCFFQYALD